MFTFHLPFFGEDGFHMFHMSAFSSKQWHMLNQLHFGRSLDNIKEIGAMDNDNLAEILQLRTLSAFQVPPLHDLCAETLGPSPSGTQRFLCDMENGNIIISILKSISLSGKIVTSK